MRTHFYTSLLMGLALLHQGCGGNESTTPVPGTGITIQVPSPVPTSTPTPGDLALPLRASFTKPLDPGSVNAQSVYVTNAEGTRVEGVVAIEEQTITFKPQTSLSLATTYTFILTPAIKDINGNALLAQEQKVSFTTRDGVWTQPEVISSQSAATNDTVVGQPALDVDPQGNAMVMWTARPLQNKFATQMYASRFDRELSRWEPQTLLTNRQDANFWVGRVRAAGNGWQKPHIFKTGDTARSWYFQTFGLDTTGRAILAWNELRVDGTWAIHAARFE
jgi:hypothetical protein